MERNSPIAINEYEFAIEKNATCGGVFEDLIYLYQKTEADPSLIEAAYIKKQSRELALLTTNHCTTLRVKDLLEEQQVTGN